MKKINIHTIQFRLLLFFGILIVIIFISTFITADILKRNQTQNEYIIKILTPSTNNLNNFYDMVSKSNMLTKNWIFIDKKENTPDKLLLLKIHDSIYPSLKAELTELKNSWENNEQFLLDTIFACTDSLFTLQKNSVISKLSKFEDYEDALVLFEATALVEKGGSIYNLTETILKKTETLKNLFTTKLLEKSDEIISSLNSFFTIILILGVIMSLTAAIIAIMTIILLVRPIYTLRDFILILSKGQFPKITLSNRKDEIGDISRAIDVLIEGLRKTAQFAKEIGSGNLKADFKPLSESDMLGNSLIEMKHSLMLAYEEEQKRKKEDENRNWVTQGIAMFADILRGNHDNLNKLCFQVIKNLVKYTNMNQGGIFLYNDDDKDNPYLELMACYAYNRQKFLEKKIQIGEGLVGTCYLEGQTIYMTDVPENYITITSGLGEATPRCIIIVPLKLNEAIYGVIELASFTPLEKYQIEFIEKVAESVASTISTVKINLRTAYLLEKSQQQAEEMRAQEEEMRQNMEELQATQEEMYRKNAESESLINGIMSTIPYFEINNEQFISKVNEIFAGLFNLEVSQFRNISLKNILDSEYVSSENYTKMWSTVNMGISVTDNFKFRIGRNVFETKCSFIPIKDKDGNINKIIALVFI